MLSDDPIFASISFYRAYNPVAFLKFNCRRVKWFYQRGTRGYADCDLWNLDMYIASIISQGTAQLESNCMSHPYGSTLRQWKKILNTVSKGFKLYRQQFMPYPGRKERKIIQRAKTLFIKYLEYLWS